MKCPYCGAELFGNMTTPYCPNSNCIVPSFPLPAEIWQDLIDGKKAQHQLRTVKDRCVKKVKAKEREIDNYVNGMSVRQSENERLAKQLRQAQDALDVAVDTLKYIRRTNPISFHFEAIEKALEQITALEQKD
jgi:Skp family chaperone for outer membrane proteins